jgi:phage regulator Rha-like protein
VSVALVIAADDGIATTTSLIVAEGTENEHASVLRLIRDNLADFEEFGLVGFEIRAREAGQHGGGDVTYAVLNEEHATLLLTYMRNNTVVRDFKKRLVHEFYAMRNRPALSGPELVAAALIEANRMLEAKDERIAELEPKAEVADRFLEAEGDLSVRDAAQSLTRAGIKVGERRLFAALAMKGWIKRAVGDGRYRVMQAAIEAGWMSVLPQSHYHPKTGILVLDPPQPRVTPKGLQRLLVDHGASA